MKKQIKWLVAALALTALATPAMALTADVSGQLGIRAFNTNDFTGAATGDRQRQVDQRLRLFTTAAANEDVKMVLGLEVDNVWGRTGATGKELGAMGTDPTGAASVLEVKHLYLDFNLPSIKGNVKAGSQAFNLGRGLIINDDAAGVQFSMPCPMIPDNTLALIWIKQAEGALDKKTDDSDFYGLKYTLKAGDLKIAPYLGMLSAGTNSFYGDGVESYYLGADVDGKAGDISYALTAILNSWETDGGADGGSLALLAKADYAMGDTKLMVEAARYGDSDNAGGNMVTLQDPKAAGSGPINNFSEIITGGQYTSNAGNVNYGGAAQLYTTNYLYLKAGASQKLSDASKVTGYVMHIEQAEDAGAADAITYGQEVDLYYDYAINKALGLNVMAAYLFADSDFSDHNLSKTGVSLNYKF